MEPYDQNDRNIVTFDAVFTGYAQAFTRFHAAAVGRDAAAAFIPLFEALNWAAALDWRIGAHWTPDGGEPLRDEWPDRLGNADLMYGVRFVRNSIHHQWSDALGVDQGARFPIRFPTAFFEWVWRPTSELPSAEPGRKQDDRGETVYGARLEGERARHTLEELGGVFEKMRGFLEPWLLRPATAPPVVTTD